MQVNPKAGKLADASDLVNVPKLITACFSEHPDPSITDQRVSFGTSGHRGSALNCSFNEDHILAITQAICEYRKLQKVEGPLFIGKDTHALSECGFVTALEVLAANGVHVMVDAAGGFTPTPVVSHAILSFNQGRPAGLADGIVITPSHNPPEDGGFKYNIPGSKEGGQGVYILYDGSMPVYIGKGNIHQRVLGHKRGKRKKEMWDHFSWYLTEPGCMHDTEAILLRMLPNYLRYLIRQSGKFIDARAQHEKSWEPERITHKLTSRKPRGRKRPK